MTVATIRTGVGARVDDVVRDDDAIRVSSAQEVRAAQEDVAHPVEDRTADVAVIGAGPAGSSVAALLARHGLHVIVVERDRFPRDKLCGEFLSPEAQEALRTIGCRDNLVALAPPALTRARFTTPGGFALAVPLPGTAWGLSRIALDTALAAHARACGARVCEGTVATAVRAAADGTRIVEVARAPGGRAIGRGGPGASGVAGTVRATLVVCAHGRRDRLDRSLDRPTFRRTTPFLGLKRHLRATDDDVGRANFAALAGSVELYVFDGGYCGLAPIETGAVNACLLLHRRFVAPLADAAWPTVLAAAGRANPALAARLQGLAPADDTVHAVAQVSLHFKDRGNALALFAGDAAGMIAPLAGDGQAMALGGAVRLADLIAHALPGAGSRLDDDDRARLAAAWNGAWRRAFGGRMRLARALQPVLLSSRAAEPAARLAAAVPGAAAWLARATRG